MTIYTSDRGSTSIGVERMNRPAGHADAFHVTLGNGCWAFFSEAELRDLGDKIQQALAANQVNATMRQPEASELAADIVNRAVRS